MRVSRSEVVYELSAKPTPRASVRSGERFVVETHDCRTGTITSEDQLHLVPDVSRVNPATGPIIVEGAVPGDLIRIAIDRVEVASRGLMLVRPGVTAFGDLVQTVHLRIARVDNGYAHVGTWKVPVAPMIGLVGVAPSQGAIGTLYGGDHGGNMDTRLIAAGSNVFLPVLVPGAYLFFGDVHAAMGDGEVFLTGVEIAGEIEARVDVLRDRQIPTPLVETNELIAPISAGRTLDLAASSALAKAMALLTVGAGMPIIEAGFLLSAACHLRVSQYVPGAVIHCRVEIPKSILRENGLSVNLAGG